MRDTPTGPALLVVGCPGSCGSVVTRAWSDAGAFLARHRDVQPPETDGSVPFEHRAVRRLHESWIDQAEAAWCVPPTAAVTARQVSRLQDVVDDLLEDADGDLAVVKDPRIALFPEAWREVVEAPVLVLVRDPLISALRLSYLHGLPMLPMLALWETYTAGALAVAQGRPHRVLDIDALRGADPASRHALGRDLAGWLAAHGPSVEPDRLGQAFTDLVGPSAATAVTDPRSYLTVHQGDMLAHLREAARTGAPVTDPRWATPSEGARRALDELRVLLEAMAHQQDADEAIDQLEDAVDRAQQALQTAQGMIHALERRVVAERAEGERLRLLLGPDADGAQAPDATDDRAPVRQAPARQGGQVVPGPRPGDLVIGTTTAPAPAQGAAGTLAG